MVAFFWWKHVEGERNWQCLMDDACRDARLEVGVGIRVPWAQVNDREGTGELDRGQSCGGESAGDHGTRR